jgi:tRNA U34 2-thiouridine synthase MnmA/TrmU
VDKVEVDNSEENNSENDNYQLQVEFDQQQRAVTPGQSVVFYDADVCLGGAIIKHTNTLNKKCEFWKNLNEE